MAKKAKSMKDGQATTGNPFAKKKGAAPFPPKKNGKSGGGNPFAKMQKGKKGCGC